jgi:hypothetical protein
MTARSTISFVAAAAGALALMLLLVSVPQAAPASGTTSSNETFQAPGES